MQQTYAEHLLDISNEVLLPKSGLVVVTGQQEYTTPRIKVALDLHKRGPGLTLQAIFEQWTPAQLVQELY